MEIGVKPGMVLISLTITSPSAVTKVSTRLRPAPVDCDERFFGGFAHAVQSFFRQACGHFHMACVGVHVLAVEIIELVVALGTLVKHDFARPAGLRSLAGLRAEHGAFDFARVDALFHEHTPIMVGRFEHCGGKLGRIALMFDLGHAKLEPARDGFTNSGYCNPACCTAASISSASVANSEAAS